MTMPRILYFIALFSLFGLNLRAQNFNVTRLDPPSWRAKSDGEEIEILVRGTRLNEVDEVTSDNRDVDVISVEHADNSNYLYVTVRLNAVDDERDVHLIFNGGRRSKSADFTLKPLENSLHGLTASDYLYLITPDRFSNGNSRNDAFADMNETDVNREEPYARHGGDIEGIQDHLDYIQNLGVTGLWISPLQENNESHASYHGYAITDHYAIDKRFGTLEEYGELVDDLHNRNMKMVMDVVYNHFGDQHYLFLDPPSADWFNQWDEYTQTNYRATALMDPYASEAQLKRMSDGWFDHHMPDVNQRNPHVAKWLIQNSIWWIDEFGIDAFRIDTYAYPDQKFMAELDSTLLSRYPDFFIFAETWVHHEPTQYWFMQENADRAFNSHLQSVTDFQFYFALKEALTQPHDWSTGINKVYYVLAHDYLYEDPSRLVTFVDNHDEGRFFGMIGEDLNKYKIGVGLMLTTRGIPCLYYGTEILMRETDGHGKMRQDFPGGWSGDEVNKFDVNQLDSTERNAFEFTQHLGQLRRDVPTLSTGKLTQWAPQNGVYVFTRSDDEKQFIILINRDENTQKVNFTNYDEILHGHRQFEVQGSTQFETGEIIHLDNEFHLPANSIQILEISHEPFE